MSSPSPDPALSQFVSTPAPTPAPTSTSIPVEATGTFPPGVSKAFGGALAGSNLLLWSSSCIYFLCVLFVLYMMFKTM